MPANFRPVNSIVYVIPLKGDFIDDNVTHYSGTAFKVANVLAA